MNPSPVSSAPEQATHDQANLTTATIREIVVFWEKRRIIYNGILIVPGIFIMLRALEVNETTTYGAILPVFYLGFWAVVFAALANICFSLAPYSEFILNTRGYRQTGMRIRPFVFSIGLVISGFVLFVAWIALGEVFYL